MGSLRAENGRPDDAIALFDRALDVGYREPEVYLRRGYLRRSEFGDRDGASQDAQEALRSDRASPTQVRRAFTMIAPEQLKRVADSQAIEALPHGERVWIAGQLDGSRIEAEVAAAMLGPLVADGNLSEEVRQGARHALALASIALGRFSEAVEIILSQEADVSRMIIHFAFNYGMALWGKSGSLVREPLHRVLEINKLEPQGRSNTELSSVHGDRALGSREAEMRRGKRPSMRAEICAPDGDENSVVGGTIACQRPTSTTICRRYSP